jgi:hypothetical protein
MSTLKKAETRTEKARRYSSQAIHLLTYQMRLLPDFLIIGGQRCGTTSLYHYLKNCPQIFTPYKKEIHFFDEHYARGERWYRAQFPTVLEKYVTGEIKHLTFRTGEATPYYIVDPRVPKRVKALLPRVKLIVLLRNPVDRAFSHHWLMSSKGLETLTFREAVASEQERTAGEREKMLRDERYLSHKIRCFAHLGTGIYVDQLQHWMQFFPREQFLILRSEDMFADPAAVVAQTLAFLDIPKAEIETLLDQQQHRKTFENRNKVRASVSKMDDDLRAHLVDYFRPHNARLRDYLGRDFNWDK